MEDAIGKWAFGEEMVNLAMNDTLIQKYGWCATTDAATVHGEPIMVYSAIQRHAPDPTGAAAAQVRQWLQGRFTQRRQGCTRGGGRLPRKAQEHPRRRAVLPSALHGRW